MFDHVVIRCSDRTASEAFYRPLLDALDVPVTGGGAFVQWGGDFSIALAGPERGVTTGLHLAFAAASREQVDAWWQLGRDAGFADAGAPGPRPRYRDDCYGAFLLDPDGNSIEAVHHGALRTGGAVDHVWLRTSDLDAARTFGRIYARCAGVAVQDGDVGDGGIHVHRPDGGGSFTWVRGEPTRNAHIALPAPRDRVDAFHAAALDAGFRSGGEPGPRPHFAPGYYAAFVLDADGTSFELVDRHGA